MCWTYLPQDDLTARKAAEVSRQSRDTVYRKSLVVLRATSPCEALLHCVRTGRSQVGGCHMHKILPPGVSRTWTHYAMLIQVYAHVLSRHTILNVVSTVSLLCLSCHRRIFVCPLGFYFSHHQKLQNILVDKKKMNTSAEINKMYTVIT